MKKILVLVFSIMIVMSQPISAQSNLGNDIVKKEKKPILSVDIKNSD